MNPTLIKPIPPFEIVGHEDFRGVSFTQGDGASFFMAAASAKESFALQPMRLIEYGGANWVVVDCRRRPEPVSFGGRVEHVHGYRCERVNTAVLRNGPMEVEGFRLVMSDAPKQTLLLPFICGSARDAEVIAVFEYGQRKEGHDLVYFFERFDKKPL